MIASQTCGASSPRVRNISHPYSEFADFHALSRAQRGDYPATCFLLSKYRNLVWNKARSYFLTGAEDEDLMQVGMIGLWRAIIDYKADRAITFSAFAKVCIANHMISAIQLATRYKHIPLNSAVSFESMLDADFLAAQVCEESAITSVNCPETRLLTHEDTLALRTRLVEVLSGFEWHVLSAYRIGKTYREIASEFGCKTKSIDNALTRIKQKLSNLPIGLADLSKAI